MVEERSSGFAWPHDAHATLETISRCFQKHLAESAALDGCATALHELTRMARANDVPPEQVLIALKRSLEDDGSMRRFPGTARAARERLIGIAIRAYYAPD